MLPDSTLPSSIYEQKLASPSSIEVQQLQIDKYPAL